MKHKPYATELDGWTKRFQLFTALCRRALPHPATPADILPRLAVDLSEATPRSPKFVFQFMRSHRCALLIGTMHDNVQCCRMKCPFSVHFNWLLLSEVNILIDEKFSARDSQVKHATGSLHDSLAVHKQLGIFFFHTFLAKVEVLDWNGSTPETTSSYIRPA